jgi:archaeosine-15-forming tRNA-guanine transglycosylase
MTSVSQPTKFIVNSKTGDVFEHKKCLIAHESDGRVRVYHKKGRKMTSVDGVDCVVVNVHSKVRATVEHPTFRYLVRRLAQREGVPLVKVTQPA